MTHLWIRGEQRSGEQRVGITPIGVATLMAQGLTVTVERSFSRAISIEGFAATGCTIADEGTWPSAPQDAIIFGLKELPDDGSPLPHRHIMFGHAFKGQLSGRALLRRFKAGGGTLFDLEYLTNKDGRRVAAFGYWAGYAGAAVALKTWAAQQAGLLPGPAHIDVYPGRDALVADLKSDLSAGLANGASKPNMIVIGALGRVGTGASDLAETLGLSVTKWDMAETAHGGPFPQILDHTIFVNCILAMPGVPVFVGLDALTTNRKLSVIADVACDPDSDYNPIPIYQKTNTFANPVQRITDGSPPLDLTAIDNLPSMLPVESSQDYAGQLLPSLQTLGEIDIGVWGRAQVVFTSHVKDL